MKRINQSWYTDDIIQDHRLRFWLLMHQEFGWAKAAIEHCYPLCVCWLDIFLPLSVLSNTYVLFHGRYSTHPHLSLVFRQIWLLVLHATFPQFHCPHVLLFLSAVYSLSGRQWCGRGISWWWVRTLWVLHLTPPPPPVLNAVSPPLIFRGRWTCVLSLSLLVDIL